jgi:hypothetical protein
MVAIVTNSVYAVNRRRFGEDDHRSRKDQHRRTANEEGDARAQSHAAVGLGRWRPPPRKHGNELGWVGVAGRRWIYERRVDDVALSHDHFELCQAHRPSQALDRHGPIRRRAGMMRQRPKIGPLRVGNCGHTRKEESVGLGEG